MKTGVVDVGGGLRGVYARGAPPRDPDNMRRLSEKGYAAVLYFDYPN